MAGLPSQSVTACGPVCRVIRIRGNQLIATRFNDFGSSGDPAGLSVKMPDPSYVSTNT